MAGAIDEFTLEEVDTYAVFDLGYNDSTAIWLFQLRPGGIDFIAHYSNHSKGMDHYFTVLDDFARTLGLRYVKIFLPHDAKQHHMTDNTVMEQTISRYSVAQVEIVPKLDPIDGIQGARWLLQQDIRFHARCEKYDGMEALRQYHRAYDEDKRVFSNTPAHDWASHSADAFRYAATVIKITQKFKTLMAQRVTAPKAPKIITATDGATLGTVKELFAEMAKQSRKRRTSCGI
jgi:phage terminase large subunit